MQLKRSDGPSIQMALWLIRSNGKESQPNAFEASPRGETQIYEGLSFNRHRAQGRKQ